METSGKEFLRVLLAHALVEISGLKISTLPDAYKVLNAIPYPIIERIVKLYRAAIPASQKFYTQNLFKAPSVSSYAKRVYEEDEKIEELGDRAVREMETKFGKQEIEEAQELDKQILQAARTPDGYRGAVRKVTND